MDHFAFASLAQIKILLVPVGSITKSLFDNRAAEIRSFDGIPLGDITVGDKDQRGAQRAFTPHQPALTLFVQLVFFPQPIHSLLVIFTSAFLHILPPNPTYPYRSSDPPHSHWVSLESPHVQLRPLNTPSRILIMPSVMSSRPNTPCLCPESVLRSKKSVMVPH